MDDNTFDDLNDNNSSENKNFDGEDAGEKFLVDKEDNYDWIACAGMLETIINSFQECNALLTKLKTEISPNPISFLVNTSEIVSSLRIKSEKYIEITEKVINNLLKVFIRKRK
ncbi:hypothetical protein QTP88_021771 [Uroleucon formosanum]